jgi:hypothetical protein
VGALTHTHTRARARAKAHQNLHGLIARIKKGKDQSFRLLFSVVKTFSDRVQAVLHPQPSAVLISFSCCYVLSEILACLVKEQGICVVFCFETSEKDHTLLKSQKIVRHNAMGITQTFEGSQ